MLSIDWLCLAGTALYAFATLAGSGTGYVGTTIETHLSFYWDGTYEGSFDFTPTNTTPGFLYNQSVFSASGRPMADHTVVIINHGDVGKGSLLLFDYAVYTYVDVVELNAPLVTLRQL